MSRRNAAGGFLAADGALLALAVANARRPLAQRRLGPLLTSFAAGLVVSELPGHVAALHAVTTAAGVAGGGARTRAGQAGLATSAASAAGLALIARENTRSTGVLDAALLEGLGAGWQTRLRVPSGVDPHAEPAVIPGLVRTLRVRRRYAHDGDLEYGDGGASTMLDLWRRPDVRPGAGRPVLLQVHGGGWMKGSRRGQAYPLMSHMAEQGWVCVSISYPLSPKATWPEHIVAIKTAIAWIRANIDRYGGDPDFVAITGGSAGGHLSALTALTANDPAFQPGFEDVDTTLTAAVPFYGVYDWTNRDGSSALVQPFIERLIAKRDLAAHRAVFEAASPRSRVTTQTPPFFVLHGANDCLVPVEGARAFVAALRATSIRPVAYAEFPGAQHAFDVLSSVRARACATAAGEFLAAVYADAA